MPYQIQRPGGRANGTGRRLCGHAGKYRLGSGRYALHVNLIELAPLFLLAAIGLLLFSTRMYFIARYGWRGRSGSPAQNVVVLYIAVIGLGCAVPYMLWVAHRDAPAGAWLDTGWLPYIGWAVVAFAVYLCLLVWQRRAH